MHILSKQKGFTLIEIVVVIVLLGIIAAVTSSVLVTGLSGFLTTQNISEANWSGQLGMERMIRDIRDVRSASDISIFTSRELRFTDMNSNNIYYKLSGTNLTRNGQILSSGINKVTFNYYDQNGATTATQANIHYVRITIQVTQKNVKYQLTSSVYLRDLPL